MVLVATAALWMRFNATPPALGKQIPSDLINYFYPLAAQVGERVRQGELPLWNPYVCSGIPLMATAQVGVFYPGNWLAAWMPAEHALPLRLFVECVLGGWFTALLFRRWGLHGFGCAAGGMLFVYGCLIGQSFWPPQVATIAWLPWLLLCVEALCGSWRWRWWVGLALGTALQLVAGFPQYAAYSAYLLVPYAIVRLRDRAPDAGGSALLRGAGMGLAGAIGVGIAAPQLLPTLELVGLGLRAGGLGPDEVHYLERYQAPGLTFLANAVDPSPKLTSFDFGVGGGYLGIPTLALAALGVVASPQRRLVWLFVAAGACALAVSFGYRAPTRPLYALYELIPTAGWFRVPERLRLLYLFCVIALAALGLDRAARGPGSRPRDLLGLGAGAVACVAIALLGPLGAAWRAALSLVLLGACAWGRERTAIRVGCAAGLSLLLAADLLHATDTQGSLRAYPKEYSEVYHAFGYSLAGPATLESARNHALEGRIQLLRVQPLTPAPPLFAAQRISCYEPLAPHPWPALHAKAGGGTTAGQFLFDLDPEEFATLYDVASVRSVLVPTGDAPYLLGALRRRWDGLGGPRVPTPRPGSGVRRVANDDALPRAYLASRFAIRDTDAALEHVVRGDLDFHELVLLDRDPGMDLASAPDAQLGSAEIRAYAPERVEIEALAERQSLLVLTDTWYPGWSVRVDGVETEVLRANGLYRAVRVPAGRHLIVFEYRPASLRRGAFASLGSLLLLIAVPLGASRAGRA